MIKILTGIAFAFLLTGCSSTRITSSWKAEPTEARQYKKILVLGLINEPDRTIREKMEETLVKNLKTLGYEAVCSCNEFDPKAFENMSEQQALEKLGNSNIDAVLTVVLLDKTKEKQYMPSRINYSTYYIYNDHFYHYYRTMYDRVYARDYYTINTKYFWESNLYNLEGKKLIYSVQSQTFAPESTSTLSEEYGKLIINDMVKKNVLSDQKKEKNALAF